MMTPASLYDKLSGNAALAELVSNRIYAARGADDVSQSHIIWQRVGTRPMPTAGEANGNETFLVRFVCFAAVFEDCDAIVEALKTALDNQALSTGDIPIYQSFRDAGIDPVTRMYRMDVDFLI